MLPYVCSYHILTSSVIYYWTDARQHEVYLLILLNVTEREIIDKQHMLSL